MITLRLVALALAVGIAALSAADGTASGTFTVQGKASTLAHAYAIDRGKQEVRVILSDVVLPAKVLDDPSQFGLQDMTRANQLHGIAFIVNAEKMVISTSMYDAAFKMGSVSVAGSHIKLDVQELSPTAIAGKLYTTKADDFNGVPYEYSVTFSAPIAKGK